MTCSITLTPSPSALRVFRKGHDDIYIMGHHEHEAYIGDRTKDALVSFADSLVPSAGQPHRKLADLTHAPKASGCNLAGGQRCRAVHLVRARLLDA